MFKRAVRAKDSSGIFPGMGGLLDVFDSLTFTPALLYFLLVWCLT
jgi:CDP-diglyceride synthetase